MEKSVIQLENINAEDFKNEILAGVKSLFQIHSSTTQKDEDVYWTREETSKFLSISLVTLWEYTRKDILQAYRIGNNVRYRKSDVINSLQKKNNFN